MVHRQSQTLKGGATASQQASSLPYVGREFVHGVVDCYSLVRDWYAREWGIELRDYDRRDQWWDHGENLYLENFQKEGFHKIPVEELQRGDALLMQLVSPFQTMQRSI